jgi:DNA-binding transcriptional MerR regulator
MNNFKQGLSASEAAKQLGVSAKALRLYEQRRLIMPARTAVGWRSYGVEELARAREVVALRALGLSLAEVSDVLAGEPNVLRSALTAHQEALEARARQLREMIEKVRSLRAGLETGKAPHAVELASVLDRPKGFEVELNLPWPWGGERFLLTVRALNFIVGPLGSGKTQLAIRLADALPNGRFLSTGRVKDSGEAIRARLAHDAQLAKRVQSALAWLMDEGATESETLTCLLAAIEADEPRIWVVEMVEDGLDQPTQEALIEFLRRRARLRCPVFLMTRSSAILDLDAVGSEESIILCPANHNPPTLVSPHPGSPGYEAVSTCLASPRVRQRTQGVVALRRPAG